MSSKSAKIAAWTNGLERAGLDSRYLGFFRFFNQQLYFEAHEVLEDLWLEKKHGANYQFYKGLIQLAGAFVHFQKNRPRPAVALLDLADKNLMNYPSAHEELDLASVQSLIGVWRQRAGALADGSRALDKYPPPSLQLAPEKPQEQ